VEGGVLGYLPHEPQECCIQSDGAAALPGAAEVRQHVALQKRRPDLQGLLQRLAKLYGKYSTQRKLNRRSQSIYHGFSIRSATSATQSRGFG